jgi:hypothetical protein
VPLGGAIVRETSARAIVRAASIIAVALAGWSVNVRWGSGTTVRGGPPMQWERIVVGAAVLSALAALAVWIGTRPGAGASRMWLRGAACACALGVAAIALHLRGEASRLGINDLVNGPGWAWLAAGAGAALAAAGGSFALRDRAGSLNQRSQGRRRGAGRRGR